MGIPYSVLIVDDERVAVEGVKGDLLTIDWLQTATLHIAYNARQARQVLQEHVVHIVLCDIEMPKGNGIELLQWMKEHVPDAETIFLTSHADFKYARQAIQLGIVDYLLKPVRLQELEKALNKAREVWMNRQENERYSQSHHMWTHHQPVFVEQFLRELIRLEIPSSLYAIKEELDKRDIALDASQPMWPILVRVRRWKKSLTLRHVQIMEYALRKCAEEWFFDNRRTGRIVRMPDHALFILLPEENEQGRTRSLEDAIKQAAAYVDICHRYFSCDVNGYVGDLRTLDQLAAEADKLQSVARNHVLHDNIVIGPGELPSTEAKEPIAWPDMKIVTAMLRQASEENVSQELPAYLQKLYRCEGWTTSALRWFKQEFMEAILPFLRERNISANVFLEDEQYEKLSDQASYSVDDLINWVDYVVTKTRKIGAFQADTESSVQQARRYIARMLDSDSLSRDSVANYVSMNPDHLTRLFKKETGHSVSDYILRERMELASKMLQETTMPISAVAASVGCFHFSHFSKIFRKYTGLNPGEYRQRQQEGKKS